MTCMTVIVKVQPEKRGEFKPCCRGLHSNRRGQELRDMTWMATDAVHGCRPHLLGGPLMTDQRLSGLLRQGTSGGERDAW